MPKWWMIGKILISLKWEIPNILVDCYLAPQKNVSSYNHNPAKVIPTIPEAIVDKFSY